MKLSSLDFGLEFLTLGILKKSNILMSQPNWYPAFYYTINHSTKSDVLTYPYPLKRGTVLIQEEGNFGLEVNTLKHITITKTFLNFG